MDPRLSFVIPCLNEKQTIKKVIDDCHEGASKCGCSYEIIVADNGSIDGSQELAQNAGASVVAIHQRGYGAALQGGIRAAKGEFIIMGDADQTYNFRQADEFINKLNSGFKLVMGNRFKGNIEDGAMPVLHYYLGNPVLSFLGRIFFGIKIGDFHCGLRAFSKNDIDSLELHCNGMEFASEMVIKASLLELPMTEIPTSLKKDPPGRKPHLKTWRDGWRHLKFMLSFAPKFNLLPIAFLFFAIAATLFALYQLQVAPFTGPNTLIFSASSTVLSANVISDYVLTQEMIYHKLDLYNTKAGSQRSFIRTILGLNKGTDRMFKYSAFMLGTSAASLAGLLNQAAKGTLASPEAQTFGFVGCIMLLLSVTFYQTASKLSSFRSLNGTNCKQRLKR